MVWYIFAYLCKDIIIYVLFAFVENAISSSLDQPESVNTNDFIQFNNIDEIENFVQISN